jgi:hypothetical protein
MNLFELLFQEQNDLFSKFFFSAPFAVHSKILLQEGQFKNQIIQHRSDGLEIRSAVLVPLHLKNGFDGRVKVQKSSSGLYKVRLFLEQEKDLHKTHALIQYQVVQHGMFLRSKPQIGLSFASEKVSLEARLKGNPFIMDFGLTSNFQQFFMGLSLKLAVNSQKYTEYAFAFGRTGENYRIIAKHTANEVAFGTFSLFQGIRLGDNTQAASVIRSRWNVKETFMQVALRHVRDDLVYKGKVSSDGRTAFVVNKKMNDLFDFCFAVDFDLKEVTSCRVADYNLGVLINFKYRGE